MMADTHGSHASGEESNSHAGPGPKKPCRVCSDFKGWAKKQSSKPSAGKENADHPASGRGRQQKKGDSADAAVEEAKGILRIVKIAVCRPPI